MTKEPYSEALGRRVASWSLRWRWALLPAVVLACVAISYGAAGLRFAGDYRVFFGEGNPDFIANETAQGRFGKTDNLAFVVIPEGGTVFAPEALAAVHALTEAAWRLPYVSRVDSLTNFQHTRGEGDDLIVAPLVDDPAALDAAEAARIEAIAKAEPLIDGFVVSPGGEATVVNAVVQFPSDVPNIASAAKQAARDIRADVQAAHPGLEIHMTGVASLSAAFEEAGLRDSATLIPAVYGIVLLVMAVVMRSISAVAAGLAVIALATLVGMGVGGWTGVLLTPISLSAPIIILTIAVADAIHLAAGVRTKMADGLAKREAIVEATALNFTPIFITSLTTVAGFLALNASDSPPFHHLGNMSAAGIAAAWLLSVTFLPALLSALPLGFAPERAGRSSSARMAEAVIAHPRKIAAAVFAAMAGLTVLLPRIELNDQWSGYFDPSLEFRQAIDAADPYFGSDQVEFILDPGAPGAVTEPAFLGVVDAFAAWLRAEEVESVAHVYALSDVMKRLNFNLNGDDPAFFEIPDDRQLAGQYLLVYELSLPRGLDLNDRVDIDRRSTRVTATMRDISTEETKAFLRRAEAWFAENGDGYGFEATGSKVLFAFVAQRNIEASFEGALILVGAIFAILAAAFRLLTVGLLSVVQNALPILATFGIWALAVGQVGFSVAAVGAVAVGLVVDFTVHVLAKYLRARRESDVADAVRFTFRTAGSAIFATTVILASGFAVLAFSAFKLNADLGLLTALAVTLAMAANLLLLPGLLLVFDRRARRPEPSARAA
ncbi:MAG: MMPL family transporter [Pseudomonadota bacterium]